MGDDKGGHGNRGAQRVAHVHGAKKEGRLDLVFLATVRAALMHFKDFGKNVRVFCDIHITLVTNRAFFHKNAVEYASFEEIGHGIELINKFRHLCRKTGRAPI